MYQSSVMDYKNKYFRDRTAVRAKFRLGWVRWGGYSTLKVSKFGRVYQSSVMDYKNKYFRDRTAVKAKLRLG